MLTVGLLARLKAKGGRQQELRELLKQARTMAQAEPRTAVWYAFETPDGQCWIFDAFEDEAGRRAHLEGQIAQALTKVAPDLLAEAPDIRPVTLLGVK